MDLTPIFSQIADFDASGFFKELLLFPEALLIAIPILAIIMGGVIAITKLVIRHRERMAKIQMGIDPDAPPTTNEHTPGGR